MAMDVMDTNDPLELRFREICRNRGIRCERPDTATGGKRLDFYLPDQGLYVELKAYMCSRLETQVNSVNEGAGPVMVLIGLAAVEAFGDLIRDY